VTTHKSHVRQHGFVLLHTYWYFGWCSRATGRPSDLLFTGSS